jgi:hypothetical protein
VENLASQEEDVFSEPLAVKAACHARISFGVASPPQSELIVRHVCANKLLARESRPLAVGDRVLDIKTHPEASHITCSLLVEGQPINGLRFNVSCDRCIEPVARHFIVIGAMKAGTTSLFELLAQHPALCRTWAEVPNVSFTKEIDYFRKLYRKGDTPLHYDWRFPFDTARHAWTLDVSPNYAKWPESRAVPARISSLGGEKKLAYILREPIDRIESHLAHALRHGGDTKDLQHFIRVSRYALHLDRFTAHCPLENILLLDFDLLRKDPGAVLAQICDYLAIDRFSVSSVIHNRRDIDFRLKARQRAHFARAVRPDVERLIGDYGFKPATRWLRRIKYWRIRHLAFRR